MTMSDQIETGLSTETIAVTSSGEPPTTSSTASSDTSIDTSGYVSSTSTASPQSTASVNGGTGSDCGSVDCGGGSLQLVDFVTSSNKSSKVNNNNCDASSTSGANGGGGGGGGGHQNGKLSPSETLTNGMSLDQASSPTHFVSNHPVHVHGVSHGLHPTFVSKMGGGTPNILHQPSANHRGHSPHRYSPNTQHSRGNSPQNPGASSSSQSQQQNPQHIVLVHVNPGETFSVRVGEQIQHIQGPATVRMVSNNGPPLPMPMQVPPGHMVQQIVDENGILTHVILSPQPPGMAGPPMTVGYYGGPNGTPQQMYPAYGPQYPTYPAAQYAGHPHPHQPHPHIHPPMPPPHGVHHTPTPHQCSSQHHTHIHPTAGAAPAHHPNHSPRGDDRAQRQRQKLQDKIQRRNMEAFYHTQNHNPPSGGPRRTKQKVNGDVAGRRTAEAHTSANSTSNDGNELEEEKKTIRELLSKMKSPNVSDVEAKSALIQLTPPECNQQEFEIDPSEFKYELQLSEKKDGKEGKYKSVYSGDATEITLKDLRPAAEYHLKVSSILDDLKGDATDPVGFKTLCCEPDSPQPPKLNNRTKTSLLLKWNATADNGAKVSSYTLEFDQGRGDINSFVEIYNGSLRQFKVTKLVASTGYKFRLAAINSVGKSEFSKSVCYYTSGSVPSEPDPPMQSEQFVKALTISWIKRPNDDDFILQMDDEATGHGFLTVYNGPDLSYKIKNLRRNTEYRFKLQASNEEGTSRWSEVVPYRTLPDRPGPLIKPQLKGKMHATGFKVTWDLPKDTGGTEVTKYVLELECGRGPELVYEGAEREYSCDQLEPGQPYRVRVSCVSAGGQSDWSDYLAVTTLAVVPGQCQPPKLQGKPRATSLHLRWALPSYDGGAPVAEYEVQMTGPDNTTREVYKGRDLDCSVAGLLPGRPYLFQVRAVNKTGAGPWSDILEVVSGAGVPDPPKSPVVHCKSPHSAIIQWEEPVNNGATITEYRLEWQQHMEGEYTQLFFGPALSFEVKGLQPATSHNFRVQALNSAGAGPFSGVATCTTPPSSPGAVMSLRASATANSIHLTWKEPPCNGSHIVSYNIDIGEKHLISVDNILDHVIEDLIPETTYKIRVQAVNGIGVGAFSSVIKVTTHSLPPLPPRMECVSSGPNSLKLKWGDGKNPDLLQYCLEMLRDNGSFHPIYHGPGQTHKVNKLSELTEYEFRINASNEAGDGPYSETFKFRTTKAPPPAVKPPRFHDLDENSCIVEWPACKPMGRDTLVYTVQIQSLSDKDMEYKQIYKGTDTKYKLGGLHCQSEYLVRVSAIRLCADGSGDLTGAFSPGVSFTTPAKAVETASTSSGVLPGKVSEHRQLTDHQWAMIIFLGFAVCAILIAFLAQKIIAYTNGGPPTMVEPATSSSAASVVDSGTSH